MTTDRAEVWAAIPGHEGRYEASSEGRIRSIPRFSPRRVRGKVLSQIVNKRGYLSVGLTSGRVEVHKLVALAFIGPRPEGMDTRHIDGDPLNPRASNLAYGTRSENVQDMLAHGRNVNANKTHCPKGHPYSGHNLYVMPTRPTVRYCRACQADFQRARRARRRQSGVV